MKTNTRVFRLLRTTVALFVLSSAPGLFANDEEVIERGLNRYVNDCAECHGNAGRGDGDGGKGLSVRPSDLTALSSANQGQFPTDYVRRVVDGRDLSSAAHGQVAMPAWGQHYRRNLSAYSEKIVQRNITELMAYLRSIQIE